MYDNASEMYNMYLETYFDQCMTLSDNKKRKLCNRYDPVNLFHETYNYEDWCKNEESVDTTRKSGKKESADLSDMPPLDGNEEVK